MIYLISALAICGIAYRIMQSASFYEAEIKRRQIQLIEFHQGQRLVDKLLICLEGAYSSPDSTMDALIHHINEYFGMEGIGIHDMNGKGLFFRISPQKARAINRYMKQKLRVCQKDCVS